MLARTSRYYRFSRAGLSALVLIALAHCAWEESQALAQHVCVLSLHRQGLPSPIDRPAHDCQHESGCICRGATLVLALDVSAWQAQALDWLPIDLFALPAMYGTDLVAATLQNDRHNMPPPLSGRQLRALYANFVI
jgi:hypothetical protein